MRVLLTATVQSHICQFHRPLVELLHEHGCEVHVAARDNLAEKNGLKLDFVDKVYNVPFSRSPKSTDNIRAYKELRKIIDSEHYDVVHCNTPMGGIVTRLAAKKARKNGTKVYYTAHGFHFYTGAPKKNWIIYYPIEKLFSKITDKLITINKEDYSFARKKFDCEVYHIHGVGVNAKRFKPVSEEEKMRLRKEFGYSTSQKILLCIGELLPNKNQKMAISMMKNIVHEFPDALLLLAGNGREKENLEAYIEECGLSKNVRLIGYCTNLEEYQKISDIVVSCSIREGLGLNLIEAMLSGNPILGTDNRGHSELICDNENGFLVSQNDVKTLSERVVQIFTCPRLEICLGEKGREKGLKYSNEYVRQELENIYF